MRIILLILFVVFTLNNTNGQVNNSENLHGQFRSFPNKFAVTLPSDWKINEISNNSVFAISASHFGEKSYSIGILEFQPGYEQPQNKITSVYEVIDSNEFIEDYKKKYNSFKLLKFDKPKVDGVDSYYFQMSYSYYSEKLQNNLSVIVSISTFLHPKTKKLYNIIVNSGVDDVAMNEMLLKKTLNSFKFL